MPAPVAERCSLVEMAERLINGLPLLFFVLTFLVRSQLLVDTQHDIRERSLDLHRERAITISAYETLLGFGEHVYYNELMGFFVEFLLVGIITVFTIVLVIPESTAPVTYFAVLGMIVVEGVVAVHVHSEPAIRLSIWSVFAFFAGVIVYYLVFGSTLLVSVGVPDDVSSLFFGCLTFLVILAFTLQRRVTLPVPSTFRQR